MSDFPSYSKWKLITKTSGDYDNYLWEQDCYLDDGTVSQEVWNYLVSIHTKTKKMYNNQRRGTSGSQKFGVRNYSQNNDYRYKDNVKKSGAVYSRIKKGVHEGETSVNAWRKTKNGLMTASAFPVDKNDHESKDGTKYQRYVVEVVNRDLGTTQTYWCLMNKSNKKIFIKELGLVISPNGSGVTSGGKRVTGFFGKVFN